MCTHRKKISILIYQFLLLLQFLFILLFSFLFPSRVFSQPFSFNQTLLKTNGGLETIDAKKPGSKAPANQEEKQEPDKDEEPKENFKYKLNGLAQLDQNFISGSTYDKQGQYPNGIIIRRLYLDHNGIMYQNWSYNFNLSVEADPPINVTNVILRDAFVNYSGFKNTNISLGQISVPSSLENYGFNSDTFFIDNALPIDGFFSLNDYGFGIYVDRTFCDKFLVALMLYQPRKDLILNGQVGFNRSDRLSEAARLTFSPIHTERQVLHFGIWGRRESYLTTFNGNVIPITFAFDGAFPEPEYEARNNGALIDTGYLRCNYSMMGGLEFGAICGPFMIEAEYMGMQASQVFSNTTPAYVLNYDLWFPGWYVEGSYVFTGESHRYDFSSGLFRRPKPECSYGAFELVLRYSTLNLTSKNIYGGEENNISVGLNWYANEIVRFTCNYIHAEAKPSLTYSDGANNTLQKRRLDILAFRVQIAF